MSSISHCISEKTNIFLAKENWQRNRDGKKENGGQVFVST